MRIRPVECGAERIQIRRLGGTEMINERIDVEDGEFFSNEGGESCHIHSLDLGISAGVLRSNKELAERIGGYRKPGANFRWETQRGSRRKATG